MVKDENGELVFEDHQNKKSRKKPEKNSDVIKRPTVMKVLLSSGVILNWDTFVQWAKQGKIDPKVMEIKNGQKESKN